MDFSETIEAIKDRLKRNAFPNESSVTFGIVRPILEKLGWNTDDPSCVYPEYPLIDSKRVDLALFISPKFPSIIIETKRVGNIENADVQLFNYAFTIGVEVAILTDGQEWHFYLLGARGGMNDKRVFKLDLLQRDVDEIKFRLDRYLSFYNVQNNFHTTNAKEDIQDNSNKETIKSTLPIAWDNLLSTKDFKLIELIKNKVEDMCGYAPDADLVRDFIDSLTAPVPILPRTPQQSQPPLQITITNRENFFKIDSYVVDSARNPTDLFLKTMEILTSKYSSFIPNFHSNSRRGSRKVVSKDQNELFPQRPDLVENFARKISSGYYIDTNNSTSSKARILSDICSIIGRPYELTIGGSKIR